MCSHHVEVKVSDPQSNVVVMHVSVMELKYKEVLQKIVAS